MATHEILATTAMEKKLRKGSSKITGRTDWIAGRYRIKYAVTAASSNAKKSSGTVMAENKISERFISKIVGLLYQKKPTNATKKPPTIWVIFLFVLAI